MENELFLRMPTDEEYDAWMEDSSREFAKDSAFVEGTTPEEEYKKIIEKSKMILPNGKNTDGTFIKVCDTSNDKNVGFVWFGKLPPLKDDQIFLYQITISEKHRGHGYGRKLLTLTHEELKKAGFNSIFLNVMKRNYAKDLYLSLGYKVANDFKHNMILSTEL